MLWALLGVLLTVGGINPSEPMFELTPSMEALKTQITVTLSQAWPAISVIMGAMIGVGMIWRLIRTAVNS